MGVERDLFDTWIHHVSNLPYNERRREIYKRTSSPRQSRFLYKYKTIDPKSETSIDHIRDIFCRSRLWMSSSLDFNDPFDMSANIYTFGTEEEKKARFRSIAINNGLEGELLAESVRHMMSANSTDLETLLNKRYKEDVSKFGVHSFSTDPRNILMWSHYSKDHTGICFQFERSRDYRVFSRALDVTYTRHYPRVNWTTDFAEQLGNVLLTKHNGWRYELEQRIILPDSAHNYLQYNSSALTGLIYGCRTDKTIKNIINELYVERMEEKQTALNFYSTITHKSDYKLAIYNNN